MYICFQAGNRLSLECFITHTDHKLVTLGFYPTWRRTSRAVVFEDFEKMKKIATRVLDVFTLDGFHTVFTEWLGHKCIEVRGSYSEGD